MLMISQRVLNAENLLKNDKIDESIEIYKQILVEDKENVDVFIGLGNAYLLLKMWEEALYNYLRAEVLSPDNSEINYFIGNLFFKKGNYKKANEYYDKAIKKGHQKSHLYWFKGLALEQIKKKKLALKSFINAYHITAKLEYCFKLAPLALELKDYQQAIRFYEIILEHEKKPLFYAELGLAYMGLEKYKESKKCYQQAKNLSKLARKYVHIDKLTFDDFINNYPNIEQKMDEVHDKIEKGTAAYKDHFELGNMFFIKEDYHKSLEAYTNARDKYLVYLNK